MVVDTLTKVVDPGGGGDYPNLAAAIADRDIGYPTDLVNGDFNLKFSLRSSDGSYDTGGYAYWDGAHYTVDETHNITVEVEDFYFHGAEWPPRIPIYVHACRTAGIDCTTPYTTFRGICTYNRWTVPWKASFWCGLVPGIFYDNCMSIVSDGGGSESWGFAAWGAAGFTAKYRNCITYYERTDATSYQYSFYEGADGGTIWAHNCSFLNPIGGAAALRAGVTSVFKNCILHGSVLKDVDGPAYFDNTSTHNAYFHVMPESGINWRNYTIYGMSAGASTLQPPMDQLLRTLTGDNRLRDDAPIAADGADLRFDPDLPVTEDVIGIKRKKHDYLGASTKTNRVIPPPPPQRPKKIKRLSSRVPSLRR